MMFDNLTGQARVWLRERQEKAAAKKAARIPDPLGVTVPEWLVRSGHVISWMAWATAAYFLWSYCIQIAGDQSSPLHITHAGTWTGNILFYFPLIVGFLLISLGIPYLAKGIIPIFVSLSWRGVEFWPKLWSLILVIAASFALVASSFSVMGGAIIEHGRGAAVAVEQVQNGRAGLQAQIDGEVAELRDMANNRNAYMAQAANVGAAAWQSTYVAQARRTHDDRLPMIERALGAAQAADARRAHITALRVQLATAATVSSVASTPASESSDWIVGAMAWIRGAWALIMSVLNDIVCLLMGWIALRLEQVRNRQMAIGGGIPKHAYMIEDHEGEAAPANMNAQAAAYEVLNRGGSRHEAAEAARAAVRPDRINSEVYDADTGEKLHKVKEHFRKTGKTKKRADGKVSEEVIIPPPELPDESGAPAGLDHGDGGDRSAWLHGPVHGEHEPLAGPTSDEVTNGDQNGDQRANDDQAQSGEQNPLQEEVEPVNPIAEAHPEPPISEEDEAAALLGLMEEQPEAGGDESAEDEPSAENADGDAIHPSLLQTPPQEIAALTEAVEDQPAPHADDDTQNSDHGARIGADDGLEQFFNGRDRAETDPRRLIAADAE